MPGEDWMFLKSDGEARLAELQAELGRAQAVRPDLLARVVDGACRRTGLRSDTVRSARISRLIAAQAWTETALALVELELPQWRLRRLLYEDGAWHCVLCRPWNVPAWLGDTAQACHECLPLAILSAFVEAVQVGEASAGQMRGSVPECHAAARGEILCCDNFT
jgi:hypothetical protein